MADVGGQRLGPSSSCWAPVGWLRRVARAGKLLALRLPVMRLEALLTLPDGALRLPADTVGVFFFLCDVTILLWRVDRALIKASSSCFSMTLQQGRVSVESVVFTAAATVCLVHSSRSSQVRLKKTLMPHNSNPTRTRTYIHHPPPLPAGFQPAPYGHTTSYWPCHFPVSPLNQV